MSVNKKISEEEKESVSIGPCDSSINRVLYWCELSIEEKIERTREQVKSTRNDVDNIDKVLRALIQGFEKHSHSHLNGEIVVPILKYFESELSKNRGRLSSIKNENEIEGKVYF